MYDAFNYYSNSLNNISRTLTGIEEKAITIPDKYYYLTCHRPENTDNKEALLEILKAADSLDSICIYPVHPRNKEAVTTLKKEYGFNNIYLCEPVSYMTSIYLLLHCKKVITDSGGLQREAFFAKKQCITVFNQVIWPETMINNRNQLANAKENDILEKLALEQSLAGCEEPFGDGNSAKKIVIAIEDFFSRKV